MTESAGRVTQIHSALAPTVFGLNAQINKHTLAFFIYIFLISYILYWYYYYPLAKLVARGI